MKKLWNDWSGPVAFTLGGTLLLAAALLMPNVPVWADPGGENPIEAPGCKGCDNGCFGILNDCVLTNCQTTPEVSCRCNKLTSCLCLCTYSYMSYCFCERIWL